MKTRIHHIDLIEENRKQILSFHERTKIQIEMIQDHAYLTGMTVEEAAIDWIENKWADKFREHYPLSKAV